MTRDEEELDPEFRDWILDKAKNADVREMVEDDYFTARLLTDILFGRSKRFNRNSRLNEDVAGGLAFLQTEFERGHDSGADDM